MFHNNGQITTFFAPLYAGGSTVITTGKTNLITFGIMFLSLILHGLA